MTHFISFLTHMVPGLLVLLALVLRPGRHPLTFAEKFGYVVALLLVMSGFFHLFSHLKMEHYRQIFGRMDHIFIWIVFATTAYGINLHFLPKDRQSFYNKLLLVLVTPGIWLKAFYYNETKGWVGFSLFGLTFFIGALSFFEISKTHGWRPLRPFLAAAGIIGMGGLCDRLDGPNIVIGYIEDHEVFHLAVLWGLGLLGRHFYRLPTTAP